MAISDKTRKILWGRSGNRCAICRQRLVVDQTDIDAESVVGDECHIHSGAVNGPRYDRDLDPLSIDDLSNLLLLCRVHHKMVDDQFETYTADLLRSIKVNHEKWVEAKFAEIPQDHPPIKIMRLREEVPARLIPVTSGNELLALVTNCHGSYQDYASDLNDVEIGIVGGFLQTLTDWVDIATDLEPLERMRVAKSLGDQLGELKASGFLVFAAKERQQIEGGTAGPSNFFVLHITVVRENDPNIVHPEAAAPRDA